MQTKQNFLLIESHDLTDACFEDIDAKRICFAKEITEIPEGVFADNTSVEEVFFEEGSQALSISENAFSNCTHLKKVTFPEGLRKIYPEAFSYCSNLKEVEFSDSIRVIGEYAFEETAIRTLRLPRSLLCVSESAFENCDELRKIYIPKAILKIGYQAFASVSTKEVFFEKEHAMVDGLDPFAFYIDDEEETNQKITFHYGYNRNEYKEQEPSFLDKRSVFSSKDDKEEIEEVKETKIPKEDFSGCYQGNDFEYSFFSDKELIIRKYCGHGVSLIVPSKVVYDGCIYQVIGLSGHSIQSLSLQTLSFEEGIKFLANDAIDAPSLLSLLLPESLLYFGKSAIHPTTHPLHLVLPKLSAILKKDCFGNANVVFYNNFLVDSAKRVTLGSSTLNDGDCESISKEQDGIRFKLLGNTAIVESIIENTETVDIPLFIMRDCIKYPVIAIGKAAFSDSNVKIINLASSVKIIATEAFLNCNKLTSINLSSIEIIETDAFNGCQQLEQIGDVTSLIHIGKRAFSGCNKLEEIKLSSRLLTLDSMAFNECLSLRYVEIPATLIGLGLAVFSDNNLHQKHRHVICVTDGNYHDNLEFFDDFNGSYGIITQ